MAEHKIELDLYKTETGWRCDYAPGCTAVVHIGENERGTLIEYASKEERDGRIVKAKFEKSQIIGVTEEDISRIVARGLLRHRIEDMLETEVEFKEMD